jgi:hypothetical protein
VFNSELVCNVIITCLFLAHSEKKKNKKFWDKLNWWYIFVPFSDIKYSAFIDVLKRIQKTAEKSEDAGIWALTDTAFEFNTNYPQDQTRVISARQTRLHRYTVGNISIIVKKSMRIIPACNAACKAQIS